MTESNAPRRQIYHHGFWDGACLLYAVANSYKALTGRKVTREKWDRAMEQVPDPRRFLTGIGATTLSYEEAVDQIEAIRDAFSESGERIEIEQLSPTAPTIDLCQEVSADTVLLFAFGAVQDASGR